MEYGPVGLIGTMRVRPGCSRARLRGEVTASLAASTGVEEAADVAVYLLAGADVVMTTSALLRHGPGHATVLLDGLASWMTRKGFAGLGDVHGRMAAFAGDGASAYGRACYLRAIQDATRDYGPCPKPERLASLISEYRRAALRAPETPAQSQRTSSSTAQGHRRRGVVRSP